MAALKTLAPCLVLLISVISTFSEAKEFVVGGKKKSWGIPSSPDEFNRWAEKIRFEIGDSIVLKYDGKTDSVLQVTEQNYKTCNKSNPIKSYNDGNTKITLENSGPYFFISGAEGHCDQGQKLEIKVLSAEHGGDGNHTAAPAPHAVDNHPLLAPAPAPTGGVCGLKAEFIGSFAILMGILALV